MFWYFFRLFKTFIPYSIHYVFIKCGSQTRVKYIEFSRVVESVGADVCRSLPGFNAFSGCDTASAFAGRGKVKGTSLQGAVSGTRMAAEG